MLNLFKTKVISMLILTRSLRNTAAFHWIRLSAGKMRCLRDYKQKDGTGYLSAVGGTQETHYL